MSNKERRKFQGQERNDSFSQCHIRNSLEEKLMGARVVKLFPVVALNSLDPSAKLGGGMSDEVSKRAESVRFKS